MTDPLAAAAAREQSARVTHWPRRVAAGAMTQAAADADLAAWAAIVTLLEHGEATTELLFVDLVEALDSAVERRGEAALAAQGSDGFAAEERRLGDLVAMRRRIAASARAQGFFTTRAAA